MIRIAFATNDGETIGEGHFAHAKKYVIYDLDENTGDMKEVGVRENLLGNLPDTDDPEEIRQFLARINMPIHGVEKYRWLHENVLNDVDVLR